jgi:hypothetical protein
MAKKRCEKCGQVHKGCTGHRKSDGQPCGQGAGWGTSHGGRGACKLHGGSSPGGVKHAQRLAAEDAVVTFGLPREGDPTTVLLEEIARTNGHVHWLADRIRALDPAALTWGLTKVEDVGASEFEGVNRTEQAVPHVWLELYHRERKHLVDVCAKALTAGVAERMVRLAESQGAVAMDLFTESLDEAGLTEEQKARVYDALRQRIIRRAA